MLTTIGFILFGYFTGSLLFARYFSNLFCGKDVTVDTPDSNPGTDVSPDSHPGTDVYAYGAPGSNSKAHGATGT